MELHVQSFGAWRSTFGDKKESEQEGCVQVEHVFGCFWAGLGPCDAQMVPRIQHLSM